MLASDASPPPPPAVNSRWRKPDVFHALSSLVVRILSISRSCATALFGRARCGSVRSNCASGGRSLWGWPMASLEAWAGPGEERSEQSRLDKQLHSSYLLNCSGSVCHPCGYSCLLTFCAHALSGSLRRAKASAGPGQAFQLSCCECFVTAFSRATT